MPNALQLRLSPSGPVIGTPPALTGGNSDVLGRVWTAQGSGVNTPVPGTAAGDILGLESTVVDLKPAAVGYSYDVELDVQTFGPVGSGEGGPGGYDLVILGSHDGGLTFPDTLASIPVGVDRLIVSGCGRIQVTNVTNPNAVDIDHVKCQIVSALATDPGFTYSPTSAALRITETSPIIVL